MKQLTRRAREAMVINYLFSTVPQYLTSASVVSPVLSGLGIWLLEWTSRCLLCVLSKVTVCFETELKYVLMMTDKETVQAYLRWLP